jgi:hypothetical protein
MYNFTLKKLELLERLYLKKKKKRPGIRHGGTHLWCQLFRRQRQEDCGLRPAWGKKYEILSGNLKAKELGSFFLK